MLFARFEHSLRKLDRTAIGPLALDPGTSESEKVSFNQNSINCRDNGWRKSRQEVSAK
jgi:hypothetical protein